MATREENIKKINGELKFLSCEVPNEIFGVKVQSASRNTREIVKIFRNRIKSFFDYSLLIVEGRHKMYLDELNLEIRNSSLA